MIARTILALINRYLKADPEVARALIPYADKVLALTLLPRYGTWYCKITAAPTLILIEADNADVTLRATPLALVNLCYAGSTTFAHEISGDLHLAQTLQKTLLAIDIDWEAQLSPLIGDTLAIGMVKQAQRLLTWQRQARTSLTRQLGEYLQEEQQYLPPRQALVDFYQAVDELRDAVERCTARLDAIIPC